MNFSHESGNIVFLDIETVPQFPSLEASPDIIAGLWEKKCLQIRKNDSDSSSLLYNRAGIYAEFGKIVCISSGIISGSSESPELQLRSFHSEIETDLLDSFKEWLVELNGTGTRLCAHNGKEFDFPYIARRMVINSISLPPVLNIAGKKPWELNFIDTMELWKFGDFKSYTSLDLLAVILGLPDPKSDISGADIAGLFWNERNYRKIVSYCENDVLTLVNVYLRMKGMKIILPDKINSNQPRETFLFR